MFYSTPHGEVFEGSKYIFFVMWVYKSIWYFVVFLKVLLFVCVCFNPFFPIKVSRLQVSDYEYFGTQILIPLKAGDQV